MQLSLSMVDKPAGHLNPYADASVLFGTRLLARRINFPLEAGDPVTDTSKLQENALNQLEKVIRLARICPIDLETTLREGLELFRGLEPLVGECVAKPDPQTANCLMLPELEGQDYQSI